MQAQYHEHFSVPLTQERTEETFKHLDKRDKMIAALLMDGWSIKQVSTALDLPWWYVEALPRSRKGKDWMQRVTPETLSQQIAQFAPYAEQFLEDMITGNLPGASLALRAKYASLALARAGYGPVTKVQSLHATLTREEIEGIKQRALSAAHAVGAITASEEQ